MKFLMRGFAATTLVLCAQWASAGTLPGPVVDAKWLAAHLDEVQVVDVRSNVKSYTAKAEVATDAKTGKRTVEEVGGHIAGSRLIDFKTMRTDRMINGLKVQYMLPSQEDFQKAVQAAGVVAGKPIVLVPMGAEVPDVDEALRVYWQFKVYGEDDIAVLDGGTAAWLQQGQPVSQEAAVGRSGNWASKADRTAQYFASSEDVVKAQSTKGVSIVDGRDAKSYHGLTLRDYVYAPGHIDGAHLYATELMFKNVGGALTFMAPATYRGLMTAQGIDASAPAITYCNSGHLASGPWFILHEVLGDSQARLYDGSLHEWTMEKRPVVGAVPLN
jgi:thiosulfate/3-mercaptopyruvate sulfurtransferase